MPAEIPFASYVKSKIEGHTFITSYGVIMQIMNSKLLYCLDAYLWQLNCRSRKMFHMIEYVSDSGLEEVGVCFFALTAIQSFLVSNLCHTSVACFVK